MDQALGPKPAPAIEARAEDVRFFDSRQKYLLFVHTCGEKQAVAARVGQELDKIAPRPPAMRVFDAGVGDGTVLTQVMRSMHARFPTVPHFVSGKEISVEDVRLALAKMPDRFCEHPATALVLTNMFYGEAPWLRVNSPGAAHGLVWREVALDGASSFAFANQIADLEGFLAETWTVKTSQKTGNPIYERPVVLVIYRKDHSFLLDAVLPRQGVFKADYDLIIASQPYRLRVPAAFKAQKVIAPLARALGPGGRLIGVHSHGDDPGEEVIRTVWPEERPFRRDRREILSETRALLGKEHRDLSYVAFSDARSLMRYDMHIQPDGFAGPIGTSTLFAAWNAATYVAQIEDERLAPVVADGTYAKATSAVLKKRGALWFNDETYVIARRGA